MTRTQSIASIESTAPSAVSGAPRTSRSRYLCYALLLLIVAFFGSIRYRLRAMPLERDEGEYAYGGQLILKAVPLYDYVYTVKLPGTHAAYAAILALLGQSQSRIHVGLIFVNAATTLLVFFLCTRWFDNLAGVVAAATYALLSTSSSVTGFAAHATHFVVVFALAGVLALLRAVDSNRKWLFFFSGLLFGIAFLMKQPGICFLLWAILFLAWRKLKLRLPWNGVTAPIATLLLGGILPFALTCLLIWHSGTFQKFWFWTFSYAREYGTNVKLSEGLMFFLRNSADATGPATWVWVIALLGSTTFLWSPRSRAQAFPVISFVACSLLAVCGGLHFRPHYYILLLPAASILAGLAVSGATGALEQWKKSPVLSTIPCFLFVLAFFTAVYHQRTFFFQMNAVQACEATYWPNPFPEMLEISNYINRTAPENAQIAVIGSEPEVYFYTKRRSATGYIYTYPLLEPQKYAATMQNEMEAEVEKSRPKIVVLVSNTNSWTDGPASGDQIFAWAAAYLGQYYDVVGLAERDESGVKYYWGDEARDHSPSSQNQVYVLKRRP